MGFVSGDGVEKRFLEMERGFGIRFLCVGGE